MRALSIKQPWAELIALGKKKIEYRSWKVGFREPLLVVASTARQDEECRKHRLDPGALPYGKAVCVVDLVDITGDEGDYEWHLRNPRRVEPVPITGYAAVYNVDDAKIRFLDGSAPPAPTASAPAEPTKKKVRKKTTRDDDDTFHPRNVLEKIILVADADPARLKKLASWAKEALPGNEVLALDDGKKALDAIEKLPQLVVVAGMLPGASGLEVAQKATGHIFTRHAKVIVLGDGPVARAATSLGFELVLGTAVEKAEFVRVLQESSPLLH
jgi:CheY-like chemotaxis protein